MVIFRRKKEDVAEAKTDRRSQQIGAERLSRSLETVGSLRHETRRKSNLML